LDSETARYASTHFGAYAVNTEQGLKVISINTDFYYKPNVFNYFHYTIPDNSGILRFLINELEESEKAGQRVWIIGHVPSGETSPTNNPTTLFSVIVKRFSPATIAGAFNGHTHKDSKLIYYDTKASNSTIVNTNNIDYSVPLNVAWVGPSIVPRTNYDAG
jgi:sphingomyelin phosphodiesterase